MTVVLFKPALDDCFYDDRLSRLDFPGPVFLFFFFFFLILGNIGKRDICYEAIYRSDSFQELNPHNRFRSCFDRSICLVKAPRGKMNKTNQWSSCQRWSSASSTSSFDERVFMHRLLVIERGSFSLPTKLEQEPRLACLCECVVILAVLSV